jgi:hypothetical protein
VIEAAGGFSSVREATRSSLILIFYLSRYVCFTVLPGSRLGGGRERSWISRGIYCSGGYLDQASAEGHLRYRFWIAYALSERTRGRSEPEKPKIYLLHLLSFPDHNLHGTRSSKSIQTSHTFHRGTISRIALSENLMKDRDI